jgi:acyl-CoA dehydrogenase
MNNDIELIIDTLERWQKNTFIDTNTSFDNKAWEQVLALGLAGLMVAEEHDGFGLGWQQAAPILQALGAGAVALPIAETILVAHLYSKYGQLPAQGILTIAPRLTGKINDGTFTGSLAGVPFGRHANKIIAQCQDTLFTITPNHAQQIDEGANLASESCDRLVFEQASIDILGKATVNEIQLCGALLRSCQSSGALTAALALTINYAQERVQFGRSISKFQAVQQSLAIFGAEAAAVDCAIKTACRAMDIDASIFAVGAAKLRTNLAIGVGTSTSHQVHAAIGFTHEYTLRNWTQRLWYWRSEFGNDRYWSERLGSTIAQRGAENFWADLTARDDKASISASA